MQCRKRARTDDDDDVEQNFGLDASLDVIEGLDDDPEWTASDHSEDEDDECGNVLIIDKALGCRETDDPSEAVDDDEAVGPTEAYRRKHMPHLKPITIRGLLQLDQHDLQAFKVIQTSDLDRGEEFWKASDDLYTQQANLRRRLHQQHSSYKACINDPDGRDLVSFISEKHKRRFATMDIDQEVDAIMADMPSNTAGVLGRTAFTTSDLDEMAPFTTDDLKSWLVYVFFMIYSDGSKFYQLFGQHGITYHLTGIGIYVGSSISKDGSGARLIKEYELPLQLAQMGIFHNKLMAAGAAKQASHRDVVSVHARPLSRLPIPTTEEERGSVASLVRFREGIFIDYLQSLVDLGEDKIISIADRDIKQHDLFVFSQSHGASDRLSGLCKGLNVCHPFIFGFQSAPSIYKAQAAAQNNQCGICKVVMHVGSGRRLAKNPLKGNVDWSTADIICRPCFTWLRIHNWAMLQWAINGGATTLQDVLDKMDYTKGVSKNTVVYPFEAEARQLEHCPICERLFHHRPPGESLVTLRKTDDQMPRSPALPFSAWPCLVDINVTCQRCHITLQNIAYEGSGNAERSRTYATSSKLVQEIQKGCSFQWLKACLVERVTRKGLSVLNATRLELQTIAAELGHCDVCERHFASRPDGMSLEAARQLNDRIAHPLHDKVKKWVCLKDVKATCTRCAKVIGRGVHEGPTASKPTSFGRAIMAAVGAGCDLAGLLQVISPKLKFD